MPAAAHSHLGIGKVAARSGFAVSAIRHYEELGLVHSVGRKGTQRVFDRSVLRRLAFIAAARNVGLTLAEIGQTLEGLPTDKAPTPVDWSRISEPWKARVDARIEELNTLRKSLDDCIGCGCLSMTTCAMLNPQDVAAQQGPGAPWVL
ncbi:redox-sensitive transcriptional activator SoxR [Arthrobacter sp. H20]|uniref:redox-sensitive transcriptional activator SoxR n=1 Tax=Arthrobacter sp. H20 TaxID=1267981 RepID=UPI00047A2301|nr:redox-sensitive transcriptional activator SoxR [Arthrobacter sp. H20]